MTYKEKQCIICGKLFIPSSGNQICCSKECSIINKKKYHIEYSRRTYIKYKERELQRHKEWYKKNREYAKEYSKNWKIENKEHCIEYGKAYKKKYYADNKPIIKERNNNYKNHRRHTDPTYKMRDWCRDQLRRCLKSKKTKHTFDILPYTPDELRLHLESQFKDDMSWDNHGTLWHIDHIKPLCLFNFINEDGTPNYDAVREANSLENLQPLYVEENLSKGGEYDEAC